MWGRALSALGLRGRIVGVVLVTAAAALAVAAVVLVLAFRGLVAAALPIATAILTLACGISAIGLLGHVAGVPTVAASLATMIGLGVGIDYALFLVTRHRELLAAGTPVVEAVARSVASSGAAVVFAGGTVVIALGGLYLAGVPILGTLAWCCGLVVLLAVAGAVGMDHHKPAVRRPLRIAIGDIVVRQPGNVVGCPNLGIGP